jgi:hypothetical protein
VDQAMAFIQRADQVGYVGRKRKIENGNWVMTSIKVCKKRNWIFEVNKVIKIQGESERRRGGWIEN